MKKLLASALFICLLCPAWAWAMMYLDDDQLSQHTAQSGIFFKAGMVISTDELLVGTNVGSGGGYLGLTNFKLYEADWTDPENTSNIWDWTWYIDWGTNAGNSAFYIESQEVGDFAFSVGQIYVVDQNLENPHNVFGLYLFGTKWTDNYFYLHTPNFTDTGISVRFDWAMDGGFLVFGDTDGAPSYGAPGFWGLENFYFFRSSTYFSSGEVDKEPVTIYNFDIDVGTNGGGQSVLRIVQNSFDDVLMGGEYFMLTDFDETAKGRLFGPFWLEGLRWTNAADPNQLLIRADPAQEGIVVSPRIGLMANQLLLGDADGFTGYGSPGYIKMEDWAFSNGAGGTVQFGEWFVRAVTDNRGTGTTIDDVSYIEIQWNRATPGTPVNFGNLTMNNARIAGNRTLGSGPSLGGILLLSPNLTASTGAGGPYYLRINSPWTGAINARPTVQTGLRISGRIHAAGGVLAWLDWSGFAGYPTPTYAGFVNMELSGHSTQAFQMDNLDFQIGSDLVTTRLFFNLPPTNVRIRADSAITDGDMLPSQFLFKHDFRGTIAITNGQLWGH
ncbi:MAG: hypothetical protein QMD09_07095 [Desulfatibacillaceae bacterium]|nr:hypothetical protein [Desulfatibacillaceae bacterium]